jgi:hypothetical protein
VLNPVKHIHAVRRGSEDERVPIEKVSPGAIECERRVADAFAVIYLHRFLLRVTEGILSYDIVIRTPDAQEAVSCCIENIPLEDVPVRIILQDDQIAGALFKTAVDHLAIRAASELQAHRWSP